MTDLNPHEKQMADESMVRNLAAQATAIWPQEVELIRRYGLADDIRILDAGCGTGEIASRLATLYARSSVLGVDVLEPHLELARQRYTALSARLAFENRSVFELGLPERSFDLTVCRHVTQAVPHADQVVAALARVTKRGGRLHLISEDYGMLHFERAELDVRDFWHEVPPLFGAATETNPFVGRDTFRIMKGLGLEDISVNYVVVDTLRVPRDTFANIIAAWRDGYVEPIAEVSRFTREQARAYFDRMIANIRDPQGYAVWQVPVWSARIP